MAASTMHSEDDLLRTAREALDKKIKDRINELAQLRSQRNSLAPISKLPSEVLSHVFSICRLLEPFGVHSPYGQPAPAWFKITHVCRHWREIALNCASLWQCIEFATPKWTTEMLRRSKNAAIVVRADLTYRAPNFLQTVQQALDHAYRIKELDLIAPQQTLCKLAAQLTRPAPLLESLRLSSQRLSAYMDTIYYIPATLFNSQAPRLRRLELVNCEIGWDSGFFHNLTHLHIDKATTYDPGRPTMAQFLKILNNTTGLQSLRLKHSAPLDLECSSVGHDPVDLPFLSKVYIQDFTEHAVAVLNRLNLPHDVKMKLECKATSGKEDEFRKLLSIVQGYRLRKVEGKQHPESFRIVVEYGSVQLIAGSLQDTTTSPFTALHAPVNPATTPQIDLIFQWAGGPSNSKTKLILSLASDSLDLHNVQSLQVYSSEPVPLQSWSATFAKLTGLKSLRMNGYQCSGPIEALAQSTPVGRAEHERAPIIFPLLNSIVLSDVDFSERLSENAEVEVFSAFQDWLEFRYLRGVPVESLSLKNCTSISEAKVSQLREVVNVTWDGVNREHCSDDESLDEFHGVYGDQLDWMSEDDMDFHNVEEIFGFPF